MPNAFRKLTDDQARAARVAYANGARHVELMARYDVSDQAINRLLSGVTYKTAGGPVGLPQARREQRETRALRERIAFLEAKVEELEFALEELSAPDPAFLNMGLTRQQMLFLGALMRYQGSVRTYEHLMAASAAASVRVLHVVAHDIRRRIPGITIEAIPGVGYIGRYLS